jgi:glycosyltransferase involved in cell wall biosynthesis
MLVWSDNQIPKFSEGYGYTPDRLWDFIGSSGLPIRRSKPTDWSEIGRVQMPPEMIALQNLGMGFMEKDDCTNEIIINHSVPEAFVKSRLYSVGYTFWETNKLPDHWVNLCNNMDEIWTCSEDMRKVFVNSGVRRPVYEFKLGVDPNIYFPKKRHPHSTFTFLSMGSPSSRKNSQMAIDAFLRMFEGNDNYRLIYKSNGDPDGRIIRNGVVSGLRHPQIEVIDEEVSHERLGEIYDMADCLIYPTSGEGWGNIPFQAIGKGIPTICTNALSCTEFADMSVPLDFRWSTWRMFGRYENCGEWAEPIFDDLCDKMLHVANNYEQIAEKTYQSALYINENMTWEKVSQPYVKRAWEILEEVKGP